MTQGAQAEAAADSIGIYGLFDRVPFLRGRYYRKFVAATAIAVLPPLAILLAHFLFSSELPAGGRGLLPAMGLTYLAGFMAVLWLHQGLLAPVAMSSAAMRRYLEDGESSPKSLGFYDDAGRLVGRTQYLLDRLEHWGARIESLSDIDEMTGVYTRRAGERRLVEEVARSERDETRFHVALVDLRGYNTIREAHGYGAGDSCLVQLVADLMTNTRKGDWIARWGTDRFLVGLHRNRDARLVSERILQAVDAVPCRISDEREIPVRVACAVMEYRPGLGQETLLARLEQALGEAKFKASATGPSLAVYRLPKPAQPDEPATPPGSPIPR